MISFGSESIWTSWQDQTTHALISARPRRIVIESSFRKWETSLRLQTMSTRTRLLERNSTRSRKYCKFPITTVRFIFPHFFELWCWNFNQTGNVGILEGRVISPPGRSTAGVLSINLKNSHPTDSTSLSSNKLPLIDNAVVKLETPMASSKDYKIEQVKVTMLVKDEKSNSLQEINGDWKPEIDN